MEVNLRMILKDLNIYGKCRAIVTDNASVIKSLAEKLKIHHIGIIFQPQFFTYLLCKIRACFVSSYFKEI